MFGTTKRSVVAKTKVASRTASKVTAYFQARALDEAMGHALSANYGQHENGGTYPLLFPIYAARWWAIEGLTAEQGQKGNFNLSARELGSKIVGEEIRERAQEGKIVLSATRPPDDSFAGLVRTEWERLNQIIESGEVPDEWFFKLHFWNDDRRTDVPNLKTAKDLGIPEMDCAQKQDDTVAWLEFYTPTEDERAEVLAFITQHTLSAEAIQAWQYKAPIKLSAGKFKE